MSNQEILLNLLFCYRISTLNTIYTKNHSLDFWVIFRECYKYEYGQYRRSSKCYYLIFHTTKQLFHISPSSTRLVTKFLWIGPFFSMHLRGSEWARTGTCIGVWCCEDDIWMLSDMLPWRVTSKCSLLASFRIATRHTKRGIRGIALSPWARIGNTINFF